MRSIARDPYPLVAMVGAVGLCGTAFGVVSVAADRFTYDFSLQLALILALIVAMALLLPFARRPGPRAIELTVMAVLTAVGVAGVGNDIVIPLLLGTVLIYHICLYLPSRIALIFGVVAALSLSLVVRPSVAWGATQAVLAFPTRLALALVFLLMVAGVTSVSRNRTFRLNATEDSDRLNLALERLSNANLDYQEYAAGIRQLSIHEERNRVSREVHDTVGHTLTNVGMMAEASYRLVRTDPTRVETFLDRIRVQAADGLTETRAALTALRNIQDAPTSGTTRIHKLVQSFRNATGVDVNLELGNLTNALAPEVFDVLYRITQESLTNSFRHGEATEVLIIFHITEEDVVHVVVRDNGRGGEEFAAGIGFAGMQERLDPFGGHLRAGNWAYGFELEAELSARQEDSE